jgi:ribonucleoside-diphosphate reductase alpha chain
MSKQGSTLAGVMDAFSIAISIALQYGVPLETYVAKFINMRFDPAGMTDDPDIRMAQSVMDYIFRRLALDHLPYDVRAQYGVFTAEERIRQVESGAYDNAPATPAAEPDVDVETLAQTAPVEQPALADGVDDDGSDATESHATAVTTVTTAPAAPGGGTNAPISTQTAVDAPLCFTCGVKMRPAGSCYVCESCGSTSGCS